MSDITYCVYIDNEVDEDDEDLELKDAFKVAEEAFKLDPETTIRIEPFVEDEDEEDEE